MAVGEETDHSICRRSEMATAGVSCIQRAARTARDNAVSALQIASAVRARSWSCWPWHRQNACQHRRRSEWFQREAAQGSPSSKQQAQAGPATVYRCAGSRAALALARLTAWTLGRGRLLNVPRVGQATLDSAREEPGRLAAAASRRASSGRAASLSGLRCCAALRCQRRIVRSEKASNLLEVVGASIQLRLC